MPCVCVCASHSLDPRFRDESQASQEASGLQTMSTQVISTLRQAALGAQGGHITQMWNISEGFLEDMA